MARLPRPDYENTYHHVIVRGVDGLPIFDTPRKKQKYINIMQDVRLTHDISIYALGFVDNHVHQFVRRNLHSMGIFYRRVNGRYGSWYNITFDRTGALYDGRYYSSLVDSENYFQAVWRYVHHQGVQAGKYHSAAEDPWSSARIYLNLASRYDWIDWQEALKKLDISEPGERVKKIIDREGEEQNWYGKENFPHELYRGQRFLAGKAFIENYMQTRKSSVREKKRGKTPVPWDDLIKEASDLSALSEEELISPGRSNPKCRHRSGLAYAGRKYGHMSVEKIAEKLGVTASGVSRMIRRCKNEEEKLKQAWDWRFSKINQ